MVKEQTLEISDWNILLYIQKLILVSLQFLSCQT